MPGVPDEPPRPRTGTVGALGITETARAVGVSPSALRLWERQGLVRPARTAGGARRYRSSDVARLHEIRRYRSVDGLNAPAIRRLLDDIGRDTRDGPPVGSATSVRAATHAGLRIAAIGDGNTMDIGRRLRELRTARGITLKAAAAASELSMSFISALERGLSGVSIAALRRLVAAYGTTLGELLDEPAVLTTRLVARPDRRILDTGDGVRIENLASAPAVLEPQLFILAAGASSEGMYAHPGEEFMFVLSGVLAIWLGDGEYYRLGEGDALTFPSTLPHRFQALGPEETRLLWINTPPTF